MGTYKRAVALGVICQVLVSSAVSCQTPADSVRARQDARHLLQGEGDALFLNPASVDSVAGALLDIRATFPDLADITHFEDDTFLTVVLDERGRGEAIQVEPLEASLVQHRVRHRVGLPALDSLNASLGADSSLVEYLGARPTQVIPRFPRVPNVPALARRYGGIPGVAFATHGVDVRGASEPLGALEMERSPDSWTFTLTRMWGDCPAGCIHRSSTVVHYSPITSRMTRGGKIFPEEGLATL